MMNLFSNLMKLILQMKKRKQTSIDSFPVHINDVEIGECSVGGFYTNVKTCGFKFFPR